MDTSLNLNSKDTLAETSGADGLPRHSAEYKQFVEWLALPVKEREPKTQKELAEQLGLSEWTLSQWKLRDGFWPEVEAIRKGWGKGKTTEVLNGLYQKALSGNASEVKLWMQIMENFAEKNKTDLTTRAVSIEISEVLARKHGDLTRDINSEVGEIN